MPDLVAFEILIPLTDNFTGSLHQPQKFLDWVKAAVGKFGGMTTLGLALEGHWYDRDLPPSANPVVDHCNWYKIGIPEGRIDELRAFTEETARLFGQKCIYFERAGEADFVWDSAHKPAKG